MKKCTAGSSIEGQRIFGTLIKAKEFLAFIGVTPPEGFNFATAENEIRENKSIKVMVWKTKERLGL